MTDTTELRRKLREALDAYREPEVYALARDLLAALDAEDAARQTRFAADHFSTETPDFDRP